MKFGTNRVEVVYIRQCGEIELAQRFHKPLAAYNFRFSLKNCADLRVSSGALESRKYYCLAWFACRMYYLPILLFYILF